MAVIKQYNKKTGTTYVYESHSYWDKERKQHRSDRKLIGKIDPETGEIIPTKKRKKASVPEAEALEKSSEKLAAKLAAYETEISELKETIQGLKEEVRERDQMIRKIRSIVSG